MKKLPLENMFSPIVFIALIVFLSYLIAHAH